METVIHYKAFSPDEHLPGVLGIFWAIEWDNFHYDADLTRKSLTAPGVTTIVAVEKDNVVGFAQIQGDGVGLQIHLSLLAVDEAWRRRGVARGLVEEGFRRLGAARMDLTSSDDARGFYRSLAHREQTGFRLYPPNKKQREARLKERELSFGTDGVRGIANKGLLPEDAFDLGLAAAKVFGGRIVVGRDTRISGGMLSAALVAGLASGGADAIDLGVLPTPGVAMLAPKLGASAAVVISASHNPFPDNGIKFLSGEGRKLPDSDERELEKLASTPSVERPTRAGIGAVERFDDAAKLYAETVFERLRPDAGGIKVLLDCANGAAFEAAPLAFGELGAKLSVVGNEPDGVNINEGCGSTHVEKLDASGHDVAFAFDGDADRVLAVDERGSVVDGDKIIAILARDLAERDALAGGVVVTVMSNLGFFKAMDGLDIPYEVTPVGDRHVATAMWRTGASIGGEQSGHVILSEYVSTGDGLMTALALLDVMVRSGKPLSELAKVMEIYPQRLINVFVEGPASAKEVAASDEVVEIVAKAEEKLGSEGRILLRPSGTEPVVRVMVEHEDKVVCREVCEEVAEAVSGTEEKA